MWTPYNPYYPATQMPIQQPVNGQPIQPIQNISQTVQKSAQCYFVNDARDLEQIRPSLNVVYLGINKDKNEIYVRQMNTNGLIDMNTYTLKSEVQEKDQYSTILERLERIENNFTAKGQVNNERNNANVNATVYAGSAQQYAGNGTNQPNVGGQVPTSTVGNV